MLSLIKITEATNLAVHALAYLSAPKRTDLCSVSEIARDLDVSEAHLAKVLQRLVKHHFIRSSRGAKGGFILAGDPAKIRLLDVLEAIDGPLSANSCSLGRPLCRPGTCLFKGLTATIRNHLERATISDYRPKRTPRKIARTQCPESVNS
jgi:Rrf2 family protein